MNKINYFLYITKKKTIKETKLLFFLNNNKQIS